MTDLEPTQTDGRRRPRKAAVPTFAPPPIRPLDMLPTGYTSNPLGPPLPPEAGAEPTPPPGPQDPSPSGPDVSERAFSVGWWEGVREALRTGRDHLNNRMGTSTGGEPGIDEETVTELFVGVLVVCVSVGAWLVSRRHPDYTIRRPDPIQEQRIAQPLSRLILRHVPIDAFPDLVDGAKLAGGVSEYLTDGPLVVSRIPAPEVPNPEEWQ